MKAVIFAGGLGTRLSEETTLIPKPMVQIGGEPIIMQIMEIYARFGINEFVILLGYKGDIIKRYFRDLNILRNDLLIDFRSNSIEHLNINSLDWKIWLLDTGQFSMTGHRLYQAKELLCDEAFFLTYGDGLANVNIESLQTFHEKHGKIVSMTSVQPDGRFGAFQSEDSGLVTKFLEKPKGDGSWVNGGFFICEPTIFEYLSDNEDLVFEQSPLQYLARDEQLMEFRHKGFWKCMDTIKDKQDLDRLASQKDIPWKIFNG